MESMQCLSTLPNEIKFAILFWVIFGFLSTSLLFGFVAENNKLKTILKYKEFLENNKI